MHRWNLRSWACLCTFLLGSTAFAQGLIPTNAQYPAASETTGLSDQTEISQLLREGQALEQQREFGEALLHYESAVRQHPQQRDLQERLTLVRIRFDLSRRYADGSFVDSNRHLSTTEALELFNEVCIKIQAHYVESPDWKALVTRGNRNLEVALREPEFLNTNTIRTATADLDRFVRYLFQSTQNAAVPDHGAARELVLALARLGESRMGIPAVPMILEYVCGATGSLDEYSSFLTPQQLDEVYSQIEGNFVGLGIELKATGGALLITNVISGGPASDAGIQKGDRIIEVDGASTQQISTEKAADMLKGEEGTVVQVMVEDDTHATRRLSIRRERVEVPSVEGVRMLDPQAGIAYLKLSSFQKTTSRDVDNALWKLHRQGMRSLIVDVRGNPGGLLNESVSVADKFVMDGTIVSTRGRSSREDADYAAHRVGTWRMSLVVLIDEDSASASEIFAGAVRDHRRGTLVGHRSYGKGSVQGIFPLRVANTGVRLTTAKFYSPSGHPISHRGVSPDVVVRKIQKTSAANGEREDAVLAAGIEVARQQVAHRGR